MVEGVELGVELAKQVYEMRYSELSDLLSDHLIAVEEKYEDVGVERRAMEIFPNLPPSTAQALLVVQEAILRSVAQFQAYQDLERAGLADSKVSQFLSQFHAADKRTQ